MKLPDQTRIANIHLHVRSLGLALEFYRDLLGFKEVNRKDSTVFLSASDAESPQIVLSEKPDAKPRSRQSPGLFHVAILFPNRKELARLFARLNRSGYPFQGFADHGVSEALYLADPEGNGMELYADRPRDQWLFENGQIAMFTEALDVDNLVAELKNDSDEWTGIHPGTTIGHIHLQVSDLAKAERFYHELLGFDITQRSYPGALFVAAGGYHHHLGFNIWNSRGISPAPSGMAGLHSFRILVPEKGVWQSVLDKMKPAGRVESMLERGFIARDFDGLTVELYYRS